MGNSPYCLSYSYRDVSLENLVLDQLIILWLILIIVHYINHRSDEGLTLETSAFLLFTVANLRFQPSC